jgi:hypothetical protein
VLDDLAIRIRPEDLGAGAAVVAGPLLVGRIAMPVDVYEQKRDDRRPNSAAPPDPYLAGKIARSLPRSGAVCDTATVGQDE